MAGDVLHIVLPAGIRTPSSSKNLHNFAWTGRPYLVSPEKVLAGRTVSMFSILKCLNSQT